MTESILNGKKILAVDDEPDVLEVLKEKILLAAPKCTLEAARSYGKAAELLRDWTYDLIILDIMFARGFDLLKLAAHRPYPLPVTILTAYGQSPESLKKLTDTGARAYLPKEKISEIIPILEDVLKYKYKPRWRRFFEKLGGFFSTEFEIDWTYDWTYKKAITRQEWQKW